MSDPQGQPPRHPGLPTQAQLVVDSDLLYPAAPITLRNAVASEQAGTWVGRPLRGYNWWFGDAGLMFMAWLFFAVLAVSIVGTGSDVGWPMLVLQVMPWIGLAGFPIFMTIWKGNGPRIDLGLRWAWSDIGWGVLYGVLSLVVASIVAFITTQFTGEFNSAAGDVGESLKGNKPLLIVFVLMIAIGAPIVEEIAFRGQVFNSIAKFRVWPIATVLISGAIFAIFHIELVRFALLFAVGTVLGLARWHTGSLTTAIVAHMCNNLPGALFLLTL